MAAGQYIMLVLQLQENRLNSATALGGALHFRDSSYGITSITDTTFTNNSVSVVNRPFEDSSSSNMSSGGDLICQVAVQLIC